MDIHVFKYSKKPELFYGKNFKGWQMNLQHKDYMCRNYILNYSTLYLYDVYWSYKYVKELWNFLEEKYATKDVGTKKFVVENFLDFKMDDIRIVVDQVEELHIIIHDIIDEGYNLQRFSSACYYWTIITFFERI